MNIRIVQCTGLNMDNYETVQCTGLNMDEYKNCTVYRSKYG